MVTNKRGRAYIIMNEIWRTSSLSAGSNCVEVRCGPWRTSSLSGGGDCVEVRCGPWRKSAGSLNNGNCVEMRTDSIMVQVRDSKDPHGPMLSFTAEDWRAAIGAIVSGEVREIT